MRFRDPGPLREPGHQSFPNGNQQTCWAGPAQEDSNHRTLSPGSESRNLWLGQRPSASNSVSLPSSLSIHLSPVHLSMIAPFIYHLCYFLATKSCPALLKPMDYSLQAPLSMEIFGQEYWGRCHSALQGIFPTQGRNPRFLHQQAGSSPLSRLGSPETGSLLSPQVVSDSVIRRSAAHQLLCPRGFSGKMSEWVAISFSIVHLPMCLSITCLITIYVYMLYVVCIYYLSMCVSVICHVYV